MTSTRRAFLTAGAAAGGGLLIGFNLWGCNKRREKHPPSPKAHELPEVGDHEINAWIRIATDSAVTLLVPEAEMGQGVLTSVSMILADELEADWVHIHARHAPADPRYGPRQSTGGSSSIRGGYKGLREAGAAAREMLIAAAAAEWGVPASECTARKSEVTHDSGMSAWFGELAERASKLKLPTAPKVKPDSELRIVGEPVKRLDTPSKVNGTAEYGLDVRRQDMLVATVAHPPFGGSLVSFDATAAKQVPGVREVFAIPTGVVVAADHFWAAKTGRDALVVEWDADGHGDLSSEAITAMCRESIAKGTVAYTQGDAAKVLRHATGRIDAVYEVPYLAHAPMEPLNCTAHVKTDQCELWVGTQTPSGCVATAAEITGLPPESITVNSMFLGGGFGRRSATDYVADAVHASKALGKPVKVVWTREDDVRGGQYRPMAYNELSGAVVEGALVAWTHRIASPSILLGMGRLEPGAVDGTSSEGAANLPYAIPNQHVTVARPVLPISIWFWRSVGSSQNAFVTECFFDELAAAAGRDPVEMRLSMLADHPRHARVLETAAKHAGWGDALGGGRARGVAVHESVGTVVAQGAEVSITQGKPVVHRVVCAVDCGSVINPDTIVAQMESGIAYGLSAALHGKITIKDGRAVEGNFDTYQAVRINEMPAIETHIVTSGDPHGGIGEPSVPLIAPAVCNALFALTGKPIRRLPIKLA